MGTSRTDREVVDGWSHGISGSSVREDRVVHVEHIWGTAITMSISGTRGREPDALRAIAGCREFFEHVDRTFSTYRPESEVALYRSGLDRPGRQSEDFDAVMRSCRELRTTTQGAFDPWSVPGGYDPSGYVKGWAAGVASAQLAGAGFADHLVNAGGDVCASGDEVPGTAQGWPVGIVNPHRPTQVVEVVALRDQAMATSGTYERGDHVVDPVTERPAVGVDSATVVGPDPGAADAFASAALVHGRGEHAAGSLTSARSGPCIWCRVRRSTCSAPPSRHDALPAKHASRPSARHTGCEALPRTRCAYPMGGRTRCANGLSVRRPAERTVSRGRPIRTGSGWVTAVAVVDDRGRTPSTSGPAVTSTRIAAAPRPERAGSIEVR